MTPIHAPHSCLKESNVFEEAHAIQTKCALSDLWLHDSDICTLLSGFPLASYDTLSLSTLFEPFHLSASVNLLNLLLMYRQLTLLIQQRVKASDIDKA